MALSQEQLQAQAKSLPWLDCLINSKGHQRRFPSDRTVEGPQATSTKSIKGQVDSSSGGQKTPRQPDTEHRLRAAKCRTYRSSFSARHRTSSPRPKRHSGKRRFTEPPLPESPPCWTGTSSPQQEPRQEGHIPSILVSQPLIGQEEVMPTRAQHSCCGPLPASTPESLPHQHRCRGGSKRNML
ncbi:hypothetical protein CRENBAI_012851 [Crenichthys baileyi]|uniref:Uncharacterized protein n=1 Tax=Crenichthys baileyi TaxID=28760 RepID=A0AAV9QT71_9TELE